MLAYACTTCLFAANLPAAELSPTGVMRVAFNDLNVRDARFERSTNTIVGPVAEVARALAKRLDVPFEMTGLNGIPAVIEAVKSGRADVGFVPCDAKTAREVDYSKPYATGRDGGQCIVVSKTGFTKLDTVNRFIDDASAGGKLPKPITR